MEHLVFMRAALEEARKAFEKQEVPVGAVLVRDGAVIARNHNRTNELHSPGAHAEALVIHEAAQVLGDWRLEETTLYVTLEPCAHCCGAIVLARVPRVVYGALDPKAGMAGSLGNLLQDPRLNHRAEVTAGVRGNPAGTLLKDFFKKRR